MQVLLFEHFKSEGRSGFLGNFSITLIDKADGKDPKRRENYWMRTPMFHFGLILKTLSDQSHAEVKCFWWAYLFGIFFAYWLDQEWI